MTIVFLLQDTGSIYGAERATLDLAAALAGRDGVDVHVLLIEETRLGSAQSDLQKALREKGLRFRAMPTARRFSPALIRAVRNQLKALRADVLHTVGYKADLHGGLAAGFGRHCPVVGTVHGWLFRPDLKERFYGWLDIQTLKRFQRVIALSRHYENLLAAQGAPRERLARIPSGLPETSVPSVKEATMVLEQDGVPVFGMLGRLSWEKNLGMLVEAARIVRERGVAAMFLVAGEGPERAALERRIRAADLTGTIELAGYMDRADFMRRVRALVLCSHMENLPYSILEAMAWGRPVVATRVGGLPDLVVHKQTGFLVAESAAADMADCLCRLAEDRQLADRLGAAGRERVLEHFTMEKCVRSHMDLYRGLVDESRRRPETESFGRKRRNGGLTADVAEHADRRGPS